MDGTREPRALEPAKSATSDATRRAERDTGVTNTGVSNTAVSNTNVTVGDVLEFIAPGFVHGMGNALFAVRGGLDSLHPGRLQLEDPDRAARLDRAHGVATSGYERARDFLATLRSLTASLEDSPPQRWSALVSGVAQCAQIPLRERGQVLDWPNGDPPATEPVADPPTVLRAAFATLIHVSRALPSPGPERIQVHLEEAIDANSAWVTLRIDADFADVSQTPLPFEFDVDRLAAELGRSLEFLVDDRANCEARDGSLFVAMRLVG